MALHPVVVVVLVVVVVVVVVVVEVVVVYTDMIPVRVGAATAAAVSRV